MFLYFVAIIGSAVFTWFMNRPVQKVESLHESKLKIINPDEAPCGSGSDIHDLLKKIIAGGPVNLGPVHVTYLVNGFTYKICLDLDDHVLEHKEHAVSRKIIHAYLMSKDTLDTKDITEYLTMYQGPNHDFYYSVPQASKKLCDILGPLAAAGTVWDTLCIYDLHGTETYINLKTDKYIYLL
jgi:hypothetical protein